MSSDARPSVLVHATEDLLEEYSFGRICEPQLSWLEEHLLICPQCRLELDDIEEYKVLIKAGLASLEHDRRAAAVALESPTGPGSPNRLASGLRRALSLPFAWPGMLASRNLAAACLVALGGTIVAWRMQSPVAMAPAVSVKLVALRGGEDSARAPSGRPLDLVFDRTDLPADLSYRAEVVNSSGRQMWTGGVRIADQNLSIRVDRPLRAGGAYWVRLYSSAGALLREFALNVE